MNEPIFDHDRLDVYRLAILPTRSRSPSNWPGPIVMRVINGFVRRI